MKLEEKCEYQSRVEELYSRAVVSWTATRAKRADHRYEPTDEVEAAANFTVDQIFMDLVARDMRQQIENLEKKHDCQMAQIKTSISFAFSPKSK